MKGSRSGALIKGFFTSLDGMARKNLEGRKRKGLFVALSEDVAEVVDGAAAQLGLSRCNLARILVVNFATLVREKGDPFAAYAAITRLMSEASVKLPTEADVEAGEPIGGNEPRPLEKITAEVGAGG